MSGHFADPVSLSTRTEYGRRFEIFNWPEKWQGIYFLLCLHVHGERVVLEVCNTMTVFRSRAIVATDHVQEISHMTALEADNLGYGISGTMEQIQEQRYRLRWVPE